MNIKTVLDKLLKGEALSDDERAFAEKFDLEKVQNDKAAAARKDAETKTAEALKRVTELEGKLDEATAAAASKSQSTTEATSALQKQVNALQKKYDEAEGREKALLRRNAIANRSAELGIVPASGVNAKLFTQMIEQAVGDVDVANADALDGVLNGFKAENPALILAGGKGGSGIQGSNPDAGAFKGANPFSKKTPNLDKAIELDTTNPELAKRLKAEADAEA